jgi:hypothetical protein
VAHDSYLSRHSLLLRLSVPHNNVTCMARTYQRKSLAIVAVMICLQMIKFLQWTGFRKSKTFFGGPFTFSFMMGLGQGSRAAPPSWIQLSAVLVNMFK